MMGSLFDAIDTIIPALSQTMSSANKKKNKYPTGKPTVETGDDSEPQRFSAYEPMDIGAAILGQGIMKQRVSRTKMTSV